LQNPLVNEIGKLVACSSHIVIFSFIRRYQQQQWCLEMVLINCKICGMVRYAMKISAEDL
jgi:hypothetical protein